MAQRLVAADASPLSGLAAAGAFDLLASKSAGLVKQIRPFFERLARSDFRISSEIVRAVLEEAGES